jgi:hypothetical protein
MPRCDRHAHARASGRRVDRTLLSRAKRFVGRLCATPPPERGTPPTARSTPLAETSWEMRAKRTFLLRATSDNRCGNVAVAVQCEQSETLTSICAAASICQRSPETPQIWTLVDALLTLAFEVSGQRRAMQALGGRRDHADAWEQLPPSAPSKSWMGAGSLTALRWVEMRAWR